MANKEIISSILLFIFVACIQAINETENFTELDLSCDDNLTCSTFVTESTENVTDNFYSTEKYENETVNDRNILHPNSTDLEIYRQNKNIDFCLCDLQLDYCDINCCCDKNCTDDQMSIFSDCESIPSYYDPHYCYGLKRSYINRTKIYDDIPEQRLFCIFKSNLPRHHIVQLDTPIASLKSIEKIISRRHGWKQSLMKAELFTTGKILPKYKNNIWLYVADTEFLPLMLPDKFTSNLCVQKKSVRYLVDFSSECAHISINENNSALNPETYYKNISVLSFSNLSNSSLVDLYASECPNNTCLPINVFLCDESLSQCENLQNGTNIKLFCHFSPFHNEQSCSFIPQNIRYYFFQNVNSKLTSVNLYMFLSNITYFINDNFEFIQHFEVKFFWENYEQNFTSVLSGNPGYILGKYIMYGDLLIDNSNDTTLKYSVSKNYTDVTKNFLTFPKNYKGYCIFNSDVNSLVQFGYNMRSNCIFRHKIDISENGTTICVNLQKHIFLMWQINISRDYSGSGKYVGMFGNANREKISDWIEIVYKFNDTKVLEQVTGELKNNRLICRNIAQILSINILYAHIDFEYTKYQSKILNVFLEPQLTEYFDIQYSFGERHSVDLDLKTQIMFYDITQSKLKEYANPPHLQFSLPHDFFYPFMMGNQGTISFNLYLLFWCLYVQI